VIGVVDVADDYLNANKSNDGWDNCWQTQPWPLVNKPEGRDPELYLAVDVSAMPVDISWIDFNGTGAKVPDSPAADPAGTNVLFDGQHGFDGWTTNGRCAIEDDGSVRPIHDNSPTNDTALVTSGFTGEKGCDMKSTMPLHNTVVRLEYKMQNFEDNGAIYVDGHEIQLREAGEFLTGGVQGQTLPNALTSWATDDPTLNPITGYPAQRIKTNAYPDWSQMEIVQNVINDKNHIVVRINGRTVTDCIDNGDAKCIADTGSPWNLELATQPTFSYQYGYEWRFDTGVLNGTTDDSGNWGNIYFRNVRTFPCATAPVGVCS